MHTSRERAERARERIPGRSVDTESDVGLELTNLKIVTQAEIKSQMFNRLNHPGAPR